MSKLKSPLLSLGSRGSIGDALTYQERQGYTFARDKPIPANPRSLPQMYQRWLYEDYAYLWTQASVATKQEYATAGSRHHLTGFQYWMKYQLTYLPDIVGLWHLDRELGAIASDSSRNANHGVVIGASPVDGVIDGALNFDGTNDWVNLGFNVRPTTHATVELFLNPAAYQASGAAFSSGRSGGIIVFYPLPAGIYFLVRTTAWCFVIVPSANFPIGSFTHVALTYDPTQLSVYASGRQVAQTPATGPITYDGTPAVLGGYLSLAPPYTPEFWCKAIEDMVIVYNRTLDPTEIKRHSERGYPA